MITWLACLDCDTVWRGVSLCFVCGQPGEPDDGPQITSQFSIPLTPVVLPGSALLSGAGARLPRSTD